jgi:hypothetical protein
MRWFFRALRLVLRSVHLGGQTYLVSFSSVHRKTAVDGWVLRTIVRRSLPFTLGLSTDTDTHDENKGKNRGSFSFVFCSLVGQMKLISRGHCSVMGQVKPWVTAQLNTISGEVFFTSNYLKQLHLYTFGLLQSPRTEAYIAKLFEIIALCKGWASFTYVDRQKSSVCMTGWAGLGDRGRG